MSRDVAASIRQQLLNESKRQDRPFQELLQYFAMERFLYRLSLHPLADRFILKGALLMTAWRAAQSRPTVDIDLSARTSNDLDHVRGWIEELCAFIVDEDGVHFDPESIEILRIKEDAEYEGLRVRFDATLARARVPMQIDIGFGDVITPPASRISYPAILELPQPSLWAYPKETVIAEKLEALTMLGLLNSRLKIVLMSGFWRRCTTSTAARCRAQSGQLSPTGLQQSRASPSDSLLNSAATRPANCNGPRSASVAVFRMHLKNSEAL